MKTLLRLTAAAALIGALVAIPVAGGASDALDNAQFVPVSTEGPAWYDAAFAQQVLAAGDEGVRLPAGVQMPAAATDVLPGIHPGQWLITLINNSKSIGFAWCTASFIFQKSTTYGIGTAGHCAAKDALGSGVVTAFVVPPPASGKLPGIYAIGKFSIVHNNGIGDDFAMVSIYSQFNSWVSPTYPVWGGPTGAYTANLPTEVNWVGNALAIGTGGTPRSGVAPIWNAAKGNAFAWYGPSFVGDSGAGVLAGVDATTAGVEEAAGNLTHIVILDGTEILPGMMAGTKISKILSIANGWTLMKGSLVGVP